MDLGAARGKGGDVARETEEARFLDTVQSQRDMRCVITDSQAIDVVSPLLMGNDIPHTTFSIVMANYLSGGALSTFVDGLEGLSQMASGERPKKVLISEACNHDRITSTCDDIGLVQLPKVLERLVPGVEFQHTFGRDDEFLSDDLSKEYGLVLHCGGCMLSPQQMRARIDVMESLGVPLTNYGVLLSYAKSAAALNEVIKPYDLELPSSML
ncbi:hypothetical protein KIPB_008234 [Kipferlia bialata]|uniref:Uncharacterized protein n=1 Tax=Kipferlia bialata TaxID=797122 RepID=A0A9K3GLA7_9EUKA|nr:hypothetical protein KIPB_008234 [Kipferlia bialata]|eukprot:g8234.t1